MTIEEIREWRNNLKGPIPLYVIRYIDPLLSELDREKEENTRLKQTYSELNNKEYIEKLAVAYCDKLGLHSQYERKQYSRAYWGFISGFKASLERIELPIK